MPLKNKQLKSKQLKSNQYIKRLNEIKEGVKVTLLIVNLTFTVFNDSELLALVRESYNHMVKVKQIHIIRSKSEN